MVPRTYISGVGMCCGLTSELNPLFCHWAACANDCHHRGLHDVQSGRVVILVIKVTVGLARVRRSAQESVVLASFELGSAGIGFPRQGSGFDGSPAFVEFGRTEHAEIVRWAALFLRIYTISEVMDAVGFLCKHRVIWCICGSVRFGPNPCRFMGEGIRSEPAEFPSYCGSNSATTLLPSFSWYGVGG